MKHIASAFLGFLLLAASSAKADTYALGKSMLWEGPTAGNDSVLLVVSPQTGMWTATANAPWLHVSPASQAGSGSTNVMFSVDVNLGGTRSGTLSIGDQTLTITQAGSTYFPAQYLTTLVSSGLSQPAGIALSGAGDVFIADTGNNAVKKWNAATNGLTTLVSTGLNAPYSVALDAAGNVYIADKGNNAVKEWIAASSNVTTLVSSGLYAPSGVALDVQGNVYIADGTNGVVYEWTVADSNVVTLPAMAVPSICTAPGLAVDLVGNVFSDNTCNRTVNEVPVGSSNSTYLFAPGFALPAGMAVDGSGNLFVADATDDWIWEWSAATGATIHPASGFNQPLGVAVDAMGDLYIADTLNNSIKELRSFFVDTSLKLESLAAGTDSLPAIVPASTYSAALPAPISNQPWLSVTGVTNGVVSFAFTRSASTRTGNITWLGQSFTVTQQTPSHSLGTTTLLEGGAAGLDSVTLAVYPNSTTWTASTNAPWLHLDPSNQSGTGSTNLIFSFDANPGAPRSGTLTIAGQTLTVTQAGSTYVAAGVTPLVSGWSYADGISVDTAGNIYIAVADHNEILEWVAASNSVTPVVSTGLNYPVDVAVDGSGSCYILDQGSGTIKQGSAGSSLVFTLPIATGHFTLDFAGNLYVAGSGQMVEWASGGGIINRWASQEIAGPGAIAIDSAANNIYFTSGASLQKWSAASNTVTEVTSTGDYGPGFLAVDGGGNLYYSGYSGSVASSVILKWNAASNVVNKLQASGSAQYDGVAVDGAGNLYFTDSYFGVLYELAKAYLDPTPRQEGLSAGADSLPAVLPSTVNLLAPLAPLSDSPWLTITGVANGVVNYTFTTNLGLPRTAHIELLGQSVSVVQTGPTFILGTTNLFEGAAAGSDSVVLGVFPNIGTWTATANAAWLHLNPANTNGIGGTNLIFTFDANSGGARSGSITIGGQTLLVTQAGSAYVPTGPQTVLVSSGLSGPAGVAVDTSGNIFIADTNNNAVMTWTATNSALNALISSGLVNPSSVAVDKAGNIYIADAGNNAIKEWKTNGAVVTLVAAGLSNPSGVAVDLAGNVYIADTQDNAIKKWNVTNGVLTTVVATGLSSPTGVAVDVAGNVYIADTGNNVIKQWAPAGNLVTTLVASGLSSPTGVAVDGSGNIYIADSRNGAVKEWTSASNVVTVLAASALSKPAGVAVDVLGNVYFSDGNDHTLQELPRAFVDPAAQNETADAGGFFLPTILPTTENLQYPYNPVIDQPWLTVSGISNGVVSFSFTANTGSSRVAHITLLGQTITVTQSGPTISLGTTGLLVGPAVGSNSVVLAMTPKSTAWTATANATWLHLDPAYQNGVGSANVVFEYDATAGAKRSGTLTIAGQILTITQAGSTYVPTSMVGTLVTGLSSPYGVALDAAGNIYIADTFHNAIKEWTATNGVVSTLVSSGLATPADVAVDLAGNVYIADDFHNAIKEWTVTNGIVSTLVASGLNQPNGLTVDASGNVYIADTFNNAIKKWTAANGAVTTLVSSGLSDPSELALDVAGNLYIADWANNAIREWMPANSTVITLVSSGLNGPNSVAVDGSGNVYIADTTHNAVKKWTAANGTVTTLAQSGLSSPNSVAVDGAGNVYIADTTHNAIKERQTAFVDPTGKLEGLAAGSDVLPPVLPVTANLSIPFAPTSDQSWLTITGATNGVVSFAFTANAGPARTAHINLLGQSIPITQGLIGSPPTLTGIQMLTNGVVQFSFTNNPSASFTVLSSTNLLLPLANWTLVGSATNVSSDLFQFTSQPTTNDQQRYYTVRSP